MFNDKQMEFLKSIGIDIDFEHPSDDDLVMVEDTVAEKLQVSGFDDDYEITEIGKMCESILDLLE